MILHLLNFLLVWKNQKYFHCPCENLFLRVFYLGTFIRYISDWNRPWFFCFVNCVIFIILGGIKYFLGCFSFIWFVFCVNIFFVGGKSCVGFLNHIICWFFNCFNCVNIYFCLCIWCAIFIIFLFPWGVRSLISFNFVNCWLFHNRSLLLFIIINFSFSHFIFICIQLGTN